MPLINDQNIYQALQLKGIESVSVPLVTNNPTSSNCWAYHTVNDFYTQSYSLMVSANNSKHVKQLFSMNLQTMFDAIVVQTRV